jgi:hypothetical protein
MSYEDACCKMKQKADKFSVFLTDINNMNNDVKNNLDKLLQAFSDIKGTIQTCTVCYSRPPTHVFIPCMHAGICQSCAERGLNRNKCFQCRSPIESISKIFI